MTGSITILFNAFSIVGAIRAVENPVQARRIVSAFFLATKFFARSIYALIALLMSNVVSTSSGFV